MRVANARRNVCRRVRALVPLIERWSRARRDCDDDYDRRRCVPSKFNDRNWYCVPAAITQRNICFYNMANNIVRLHGVLCVCVGNSNKLQSPSVRLIVWPHSKRIAWLYGDDVVVLSTPVTGIGMQFGCATDAGSMCVCVWWAWLMMVSPGHGLAEL